MRVRPLPATAEGAANCTGRRRLIVRATRILRSLVFNLDFGKRSLVSSSASWRTSVQIDLHGPA
jgi:hypothetical protein